MPIMRIAEYPRPDHVLLHLSDTHLIAGEEPLYGAVDADARLQRLLGRIEAARAEEGILLNADFIDRQLPEIEAWIESHAVR